MPSASASLWDPLNFSSHSSAPVHEQPFRSHSPTATTVPPPVFPYHDNSTHLRPGRWSRQESISSTSEPHPLEIAAGYKADLDNPDRDTFKAIHSHPLPSSPQPTLVLLVHLTFPLHLAPRDDQVARHLDPVLPSAPQGPTHHPFSRKFLETSLMALIPGKSYLHSRHFPPTILISCRTSAH